MCTNMAVMALSFEPHMTEGRVSENHLFLIYMDIKE